MVGFEKRQLTGDLPVLVALQAKRVAGGAELLLKLADMGIVAQHAIAFAVWPVERGLRGFFVTGKAEFFFGRDQVDVGCVFINHLHFMAGGAAHGDGAVYVRSLALIFMTFKTLGCIDVFLEWDGMLARIYADCRAEQDHEKHRPEESSHPSVSPG